VVPEKFAVFFRDLGGGGCENAGVGAKKNVDLVVDDQTPGDLPNCGPVAGVIVVNNSERIWRFSVGVAGPSLQSKQSLPPLRLKLPAERRRHAHNKRHALRKEQVKFHLSNKIDTNQPQ